MTLEADLYSCLGALCANRVYPIVAPRGAALPHIVYQQIGGEGLNFLESAEPSKKNSRFQIRTWAATHAAAVALARSIEDRLVASTTLRATVLGAFIDTSEDDLDLYGTLQDFSIWY